MSARIPGRRFFRHLVVILGASVLAAAVSWSLPQRHLIQGWLIDVTAAARAVAFGVRPLSDAGVVVVTVGSRSLDSPELIDLPRALFTPVWSALTSRALEAGARSVAYDFILAYDAGRLTIGGQTPLRDLDREFLKLLHTEGRAGRIILGRSSTILPARRFRQVLGAGGLGLVEAPVGPGNVVRQVRYTIAAEDGTRLETLSGLSLRNAGVEPPASRYIVPPGPLDTIPNVELIDVLRCGEKAPLEQVFRDRLVFVGSTLAGEDRLKGSDRLIPGDVRAPTTATVTGRPADDPCRLMADEHRSAYGGSVPGVFLHAAAADAVLSGWAPTPLADWARILLSAAAAAIGAALAVFGQLRWAIAGVAVLALSAVAGGAVLLENGALLASADPLMAGPAFFAAGWAIRIWMLDRQARSIRREFGRYLSPALIARMIDQERVPELGGESRIVTVMFADLSGFTRLSTELPERELFSILNEYLDRCAGIVQRHGGYVDKFIGDAVMAIWNAPADMAGHARQAVLAGLAMSRAVDEIREASAGAGRPGLKLKVAINTGPALVGNIGSRERMNYTVVGSAVNLAARLEDLPRVFDTRVIVGEATARAVERDFVLLPVAAVRLEGIQEPVEIYSPLALAGEADGSLRALVDEYARARRLLQDGRLREALEVWDRLAAADWAGAGPSAIMLRRTMEERDRASAAAGADRALL